MCSFQWSPGHLKIPGNSQAHELAHRVLLYSIAKQSAHVQALAPNQKTLFLKTKVGRFIKSFDKALPGNHNSTIYNGRTKKHSQILCQLRTGIRRLNSYLAKIQAVESSQCGCKRGNETVDRFFIRCPLWSNLRQEFKRLAANRWGDLSYALGGWSNKRKDGPLDRWTPQTAMVSATINFAIATGRLEDRRNKHDEEESEEEEAGTDEDTET